MCEKPHQDELALSGKEALSNPLTELSLISHNAHTHYRWKEIQGTLLKVLTREKKIANLIRPGFLRKSFGIVCKRQHGLEQAC